MTTHPLHPTFSKAMDDVLDQIQPAQRERIKSAFRMLIKHPDFVAANIVMQAINPQNDFVEATTINGKVGGYTTCN